MTTPGSGLFPRETLDWRAMQLPPWRRWWVSAVAAGLTVGIPLHLFRAWALTHDVAPGPDGRPSVGYVVGIYAVRLAVLCAALSLHLAHHPVRRWARRLLAFAASEAAGELLVAVALTALGREPLGTTGRAQWGDLPAKAVIGFVLTLLALGVFTLVLAGIVQGVRTWLARRGRHHLHVEQGHLVRDGGGTGR
jgi:hypothetical protein